MCVQKPKPPSHDKFPIVRFPIVYESRPRELGTAILEYHDGEHGDVKDIQDKFHGQSLVSKEFRFSLP